MTARHVAVLCLFVACFAAPVPARAQTFRPTPASPVDDGAWYPLIVTGGRSALDALGVPESLDLGSAVVDLVRRLHLSATPPPELNEAIRQLSLASADLTRLQNAIALATVGGRAPTLAGATDRNARKTFQQAVEAAGLRLRETDKQLAI